MTIVTLTYAQEHLGDLVSRAEAGETIQISNEDRMVAQLTPAKPAKKPIDIEALNRVTEGMPYQETSAGEFIRAMRDSDRY
ncbi:type II toxin-antitoxin system Phd/YefM family antitoxin [Pararhizobium qamdonense]|uniref:type II toxin-antitoxin system Phd/YefM family antitoxin n=1 Tax=Pararhizobium qamdonense TaxID=3031126 RepID=UPI0023E343C9|nr:type II toxin-antitoxin system prevent-host-death family antitoxin [Pararhizobium qamdonense]